MSQPPFFSDKRRLLLWLLALALLAAGLLGAMALHRWIRRLPVPGLEVAARTAWTARDPTNAGLAARRILEVDINNPVATRVMAEISTAMKSPESLRWWVRVVELSPEDRPARESLALAQIGQRDWKAVEDVLGVAEKDFPGHVSWPRLRCMLAASRGDIVEATRLFRELKGEMGSPGLTLTLHALEAAQADPEVVSRGRAGLAKLAATPGPVGLKAASSLLKLAVERGDQEESARWAVRLLEDPDCDPGERLDALGHLAKSGRPWKQHLVVLRSDALRTARGSHRLLGWLNSFGELGEARSLLSSAPKQWFLSPPSSLSAGETLVLQKDWPALGKFLGECTWDARDPFRRMLELRWRKEQTNLEGGGSYETEAMTFARETAEIPGIIERVLALARSWGWDDLRDLLLRERAKRWPQTELASLKELFELNQKRKNLRGQFTAMARVLEINPNDPVAMNNVAYLRLILDEDLPTAHRLAAKVFQDNPKTYVFHPTLALSLVLRKRPAEALELFQEIPEKPLGFTEVRYSHAIALAASGKLVEAEARMKGIALEEFAPEEWLLLERFGLHRPKP